MNKLLASILTLSVTLLLESCCSKLENASQNLFSNDLNTREEARQALQKCKSADALKILGGAYMTSTDITWKIALANALGEKKHPDCVMFLLPVPMDKPELADAVVKALGGVNHPEAINAVLTSAKQLKTITADFALIDTAPLLPQKDALALYENLWKNSPHTAVRAAALTQLFVNNHNVRTCDFKDRTRELTAALRNLSHAADTPAKNKTLADLDRCFKSLPSEAQDLFITLAATTKNNAFAPTARTAAKSQNESIRTNAIASLLKIGDSSDFQLIFNAALKDNSSLVRNTAKTVLTQVTWPAADELIATNLNAPEETQLAAISIIKARRCDHFNKQLINLADKGSQPVAMAAIDALAYLATPEDAPDFIPLLNRDDRCQPTAKALDKLIKTCKEIALNCPEAQTKRQPAKRQWDKFFANALTQEASAKGTLTDNAKQALVTVATKLGGLRTLKAIAETGAYANALPTILAQWPSPRHATLVLNYSKSLKDPFQRAEILGNVIKLTAKQTRNTTPEQKLKNILDLLALAERDMEREIAVVELVNMKNPEAFDALVKLMETKKYTEIVARHICDAILNLPEMDVDTSIAILRNTMKRTAVESTRNSCVDTIRKLCLPLGYIKNWEYSQAYIAKDDKGKDSCPAAHHKQFEPELPGAKIAWKNAPVVEKYGVPAVVELHKLLGGVHRTAYIKTTFKMNETTEALLEIGADDMLKVWVNGKVVLDKPKYQALKPATDVLKIKLNKGRNTIMLKVSQGTNDWEACAALKKLDGTELKY